MSNLPFSPNGVDLVEKIINLYVKNILFNTHSKITSIYILFALVLNTQRITSWPVFHVFALLEFQSILFFLTYLVFVFLPISVDFCGFLMLKHRLICNKYDTDT